MKVNEGDLVTVHYDHADGTRQSEAGVVVYTGERLYGRTELWLHPGELEGKPAAVVEVIFGDQYGSYVKRAQRPERAVLFKDGRLCDGFERKRVTDRVSNANGANVEVKKVSGNDPTMIYADAVARGDWNT